MKEVIAGLLKLLRQYPLARQQQRLRHLSQRQSQRKRRSRENRRPPQLFRSPPQGSRPRGLFLPSAFRPGGCRNIQLRRRKQIRSVAELSARPPLQAAASHPRGLWQEVSSAPSSTVPLRSTPRQGSPRRPPPPQLLRVPQSPDSIAMERSSWPPHQKGSPAGASGTPCDLPAPARPQAPFQP